MRKLGEVLAQEDTVLCIGSGISMWSDLPSWPKLIEELAEYVEAMGANADLIRAEAARGDLLQAASFGFDKLTKPQIGDFVRSACRYGKVTPHEIHRKIVSLGPRCFITTNYDNLLEESLRLWQPDRFYRPPVTNRQLTEMAEIIHARATDFVFKPHGDASDSDSIILTREQYRDLLPDGERHAALESFKMLLATRPVVYLGFGLRDPNFIYLRDLLANTYKGGTRDHYAIMADVSADEIDYWRRHYGIHLIPYQTLKRSDGSKDHSQLLTLLNALSKTVETTANDSSSQLGFSPSIILALMRHCAGLTRISKSNPEIPIRVHLQDAQRNNREYWLRDSFSGWPIERFLDEGPQNALLIGTPGAGKTYAIRQAAARIAERLYQSCLEGSATTENVVVPLYADMKLYRGDLEELLVQSLPAELDLKPLAEQTKIKIFLDSFNEMPREFWENGSYETDLAAFIEKFRKPSLVIGSRTTDGLAKTGFPSYHLDHIDESYVSAELQRLGLNLSGRFEREVLWLLQKPFYFMRVTNGTVNLPRNPKPSDFYKVFFDELLQAFRERFDSDLDLLQVLSTSAYDSINRGEEAQPVAGIVRTIIAEYTRTGIPRLTPQDVVNWLVSRSVMIPYSGSRVAFFHQSATEFLAASELARIYQATPEILNEKLSLTRWDQALFLTLSLLPTDTANSFLQSVIETDFVLALKATKYVEFGRTEVVRRLLSEIPRRSLDLDEHSIANALEFWMSLDEAHIPQLREIMKCGSTLAAAAVGRLVQLKGAAVKDELLHVLVENRHDYNYCCSGIAPALAPYFTAEDVGQLLTYADSIADEVKVDSDDDVAHGFISASGDLLATLDLTVVKNALLDNKDLSQLSEIRIRILSDALREQHSTAALELAGEFLLSGVNRAATIIYFIAHFGKEEVLSWNSFGNDHVQRLISMIIGSDDDWGLRALQCLCEARPDLAASVVSRAMQSSGLKKALPLYCATTDADEANALMFNTLAELLTMDEEQRHQQPIKVLKQIDLDWSGRESLLIKLLKLRDAELAFALLEGMFHENKVGELDIGDIEWWLDWMLDIRDPHLTYWLKDRIGNLFAQHLSPTARDAFVAEFNKPKSRFRGLLADWFLVKRSDLTTDDFSDDAISFLLSALRRGTTRGDRNGYLLGRVATESFVVERLMPLLAEATEPLLSGLKKVLREAGRRHGRRYIAE